MTDTPQDDGLIERLRETVPSGYVELIPPMVASEVRKMDNGTLVACKKYSDAKALTKLRNPDGPEAADRIAALRAENEALRVGLDDLRDSVIAFGAPWAVAYAKDCGFAEGELHPTHYDILANAGARMVDFKRADIGASHEPG